METPNFGEDRAFPFELVPVGWAPCDGRSLTISENQALAAPLGPTTMEAALPSLDYPTCVAEHPPEATSHAARTSI